MEFTQNAKLSCLFRFAIARAQDARDCSEIVYRSKIARDWFEIAESHVLKGPRLVEIAPRSLGVGASTVPRSLQIGPRSPSPTFSKSKIGRDCTEIAGDWGFYTSKIARDCSEIAESHVL